MVTSSTPVEDEAEPLPHKEPNRIPVLSDAEFDAAVAQGAKILRMGKGSFLRLAGIEKLMDMGLWHVKPRRKKGQSTTR